MTSFTIKDVAERAGVSAKTVSRVINGEAHVRAELREQVLRVVAEMDYRPNAFARGLSSSRAFLLGLFFDDPSSGYAADVQRGALRQCRERGYHLVIEEVDPEKVKWRERLVATLREIRLAGAILTPPICDAPELLDILEQHAVPVVRIAPGLDPERSPQVFMDDRAAAREMTELLIGLGHRDIAFIKGKPFHIASPRRLEGFCAAMTEAGLPVRPEWVLDGDFSFRSGLEGMETILQRGARPTAVFASNDETALGVLVAALRHHIPVPDALSVVGFDDAPIARMAWPQLTTIRQPNEEMAAAAVDLLVDGGRADGGAQPAHLRLEHELIRRPSSGPVSRPPG